MTDGVLSAEPKTLLPLHLNLVLFLQIWETQAVQISIDSLAEVLPLNGFCQQIVSLFRAAWKAN